MIKTILKLLDKYQRFVVYSFIGLVGATTDVLLFKFLHDDLFVRYALANLYSVAIGVMITFILNTFLNFKVTDHIIRRLGMYSLVGIVGMLLQLFALFVFSDVMSFNATLVKIAFTPVVAVVQYTLNAAFSFSDKLLEGIE